MIDTEDFAVQLPPHELLLRYPEVNVCAPMVRYSKHAFRALVARYDTHITTTPMMLAKEFVQSPMARKSEFSTGVDERGLFRLTERKRKQPNGEDQELEAPVKRKDGQLVRGSLVAQFAANQPVDLADVAELMSPHVDGIDINCGCPQSWAYSDGIGSALLRKPDLVRDLLLAARARVGNGFCLSVKIRVDSDLRLTDLLVRTALHAGANMIGIHGRTRTQSSDSTPVDLDAIAFAVSAAQSCGSRVACASPLQISEEQEREETMKGIVRTFDGGGAGGPVACVANGDVFSLEDAVHTRKVTKATGVMSARGLLANPALFSGYATTPPEAVAAFARLGIAYGLTTALYQRHLTYMLEQSLPRSTLRHISQLSSPASMLDWLADEDWLGGPDDPYTRKQSYTSRTPTISSVSHWPDLWKPYT